MDVICSSDIKTRHIYSFLISVAIIIIFFLGGIQLKSYLQNIKFNYFLYHQKHIKEFDDMVIKQKLFADGKKFIKDALQKDFHNYAKNKIFISFALVVVIVTLLTLKYSIPDARDLFLPFENECGPDLVSLLCYIG